MVWQRNWFGFGVNDMLNLKVLVFGASMCVASVCQAAGLSDESYVTDRLVAARVADVISKDCEAIDARMFRALRQAYALRDWALNKGYTEDEIKAFLDSKADKERIYGLASRYIDSRLPEDGSLCSLGREEINSNSFIGSLMALK